MFYRNLRRTILTISILILIGFLFLNYINYEREISNFIEQHLADWGLLGFAIIVFLLESVPQPFLSALAVLFTGTILGFNFIDLFILTIISSVLANYTAYFIGKSLGQSTVGLFISQENYTKSTHWFDKYGKKAISLVALTPLPYFPIIGGIFKMTFREFTTYAIIPRILHFIIFGGLLTLFI